MKLAIFVADEKTDSLEWFKSSLFILELEQLSENAKIQKLLVAIESASLRDNIIQDFCEVDKTVKNFERIFKQQTLQDKTVYQRQLEELTFKEGSSCVDFWRTIQRLVVKSFAQDLTNLNVSNATNQEHTAMQFRKKMPTYIKEYSGFICHTDNTIELARFTEKLITNVKLYSPEGQLGGAV